MDSTFFRIVVAISGLLLIAGLFLWEWLHKRALNKTEAVIREQRQKQFAGEEPVVTEEMKAEVTERNPEELALPSMKASRSTAAITEEIAPKLEPEPETKSKPLPNVIQISIVARDQDGFDGAKLRNNLEGLGLTQGDMGIYHRHFDPQNNDRFSVANLVEPGTFPNDRQQPFSTPGVVLFLEVSEQLNPLIVFDELIHTANSLSKELEGTLLDEKHRPLAEESLSELRQLFANQ